MNLCRETTEEYSREVAALGGRLMTAMSVGLGVGETRLQEAFGGADGAGVCVRVNYYPRCPQPELTLGLSSHSDPGGMTVLLADDRVRGLQVRRRGAWVTVDPVPDAFIVNVGDQIQVCTYVRVCSRTHAPDRYDDDDDAVCMCGLYDGTCLILPAGRPGTVHVSRQCN